MAILHNTSLNLHIFLFLSLDYFVVSPYIIYVTYPRLLFSISLSIFYYIIVKTPNKLAKFAFVLYTFITKHSLLTQKNDICSILHKPLSHFTFLFFFCLIAIFLCLNIFHFRLNIHHLCLSCLIIIVSSLKYYCTSLLNNRHCKKHKP